MNSGSLKKILPPNNSFANHLYLIYHHHLVMPIARISLILSCHFSLSLPLAGLQGYIPYPHIATECIFVLVILLLPGHMWGSIGVYSSKKVMMFRCLDNCLVFITSLVILNTLWSTVLIIFWSAVFSELLDCATEAYSILCRPGSEPIFLFFSRKRNYCGRKLNGISVLNIKGIILKIRFHSFCFNLSQHSFSRDPSF